MQQYTPRSFTLPELSGISAKQIEEHLKLYQGYVAHTNTIMEQVEAWSAEPYLMQELLRRFGFEFDGMRNHDYYFGALEVGPTELPESSALAQKLAEQYGSVAEALATLTRIGMTRGSGWAMLYYDPHAEYFLARWVDEHHLGHLTALPVIIALDCWEHAYMVDHPPSGRGAYIESYLANINWETINQWYEAATRLK